MRFWLVSPFEPLPQLGYPVGRYRALARELVRRGHEVVWWSTDFFHFRKAYRVGPVDPSAEDPYTVRLIHAPAYRDNQSLRRVWSHAALAARTVAAMRREPRRPDVILGTAPPVELSSGLVSYARQHGIPACLDVIDIWPDSFEMVLPSRLRRLAPLLLLPHRQLMRRALRNCAAIIAVSETYLEWALRYRGGQPARHDIFRWAAPIHAPARPPTAGPGPFQATFCGTFGVTYDFDLMLQAAASLQRSHPDAFQLNLVGDGPRRDEVLSKTLSPNARVLGPVGEVDRNRILQQSAAGLCCYVADAPQSLPIKLFDYLSFGLPVVSTLPGEPRRFLEQHDAGITISGARELATALLQLRDEPERWDRMSRAARAYTEQHTLGSESARLADLLEGLV